MIVKIQPLASNITNALRYNENKSEAKEGCLSPDEELEYLKSNSTGHILATFNVPEPSTLQNEFARLKMLNERNARGRKLLNPTLHISVNPGERDRKLSEAEVVDFIVEVMDKLGYGETPYRIYRHDDNGRTHYHIVGIRIGQDGKKIRDNYENKHCEKICRDLAQKYDYIYGLEGVKGIEEQTGKTDAVASDNKPDEELHPESAKTSVIEKEGAKTADKDKKKKEKSTVGRFDLKSPVGQAEQFRAFHEEAMKWNFSTPIQYALLMRYRFGCRAEVVGDTEEVFQFSGLNSGGGAVTTPVTEKELGINALVDVLQRCSQIKMNKRISQRKHLEKVVTEEVEKAESWKDLTANLRKRGIFLVLSWSDDNRLFGMTWLDSGTKCIWKGSQTSVGMDWLKEMLSQKGWKLKAGEASGMGRNVVSRNGKLNEMSEKGQILAALKRAGGSAPRVSNDASKRKSEIDYGEEGMQELTI